MTEPTRAALLRRLVAGERLGREQAGRLAALGWDSDEELVVLRAQDAVATLDPVLDGTRTIEEVAAWAEALEGREDIGLEPSAERELGALLFELANPEINGPLTTAVALDWRRRLLADPPPADRTRKIEP